jgi:hypothetical protein
LRRYFTRFLEAYKSVFCRRPDVPIETLSVVAPDGTVKEKATPKEKTKVVKEKLVKEKVVKPPSTRKRSAPSAPSSKAATSETEFKDNEELEKIEDSVNGLSTPEAPPAAKRPRRSNPKRVTSKPPSPLISEGELDDM